MPNTSFSPSVQPDGSRTAPPASVPLTPAGERLLGAASELFYAHGIHAVGVDLIAESAGTTKKTLYDRFGSKDALVALYLQRRVERWRRYLERYLEEHSAAAADADTVVDRAIAQVVLVLDALEGWNNELTRGCAFVNAYAEIGGTDHPGVAVIRAEKQWIRDVYARLLAEAGVDADRATELSAQVSLVHEGVLIGMTVGGDMQAFDWARGAVRHLLASALASQAPARVPGRSPIRPA